MHEGVHEKSVKLSIAGSARGGFSGGGVGRRSVASSGGGRGGTVGSGGRGVNDGKQSPTGGGSFIPVYAAAGVLVLPMMSVSCLSAKGGAMVIRKLAFLVIFFCIFFSASPSSNIMVSASMHEGVHEENVKLSTGGGVRGGFGGGSRSSGSSGGGHDGVGGKGGRGGNGGKQRPSGGGNFNPIYVANRNDSAANCQTSAMFFTKLGASVMALSCLIF
ncbi:hypothetical protein CKAN_01103100 [Cinnamomum micranthum f. kanehirae]|uniref:Uncharacterized protein n=1 Tax=Cinnamomum micranthum f. kanehirae TaxID=337451 RepID=A0A443NUY2_9MAGN|nr:hypothetical protein CKAN_01103100 [Cinnamomum micranthum f. kanehirae]